jgi:hypothetical protein
MFDATTIRAVADIVQWLVVAVAVGILLLSLYVIRRWRQFWPYLLSPFLLAVHSILFYWFALRDVLPPPWGNLWSATLRLHSYVVILATMGVVALSYHRQNHNEADNE